MCAVPPNYPFAHAMALLAMPVFMLAFYAVYCALMEKTLVLDIINTALTIALGLCIGRCLTLSTMNLATPSHHVAALLLPMSMLAVYAVFTFHPPECALFQDPVSLRYGIPPQ